MLRHSTMNSRHPPGFTLIELLIAVAVVGILATIAYPSYINSIIKGNRANTQSFLMDLALLEQQYLLDNRSYAADLASLNRTVPEDVSRFYSITFSAPPGSPPSFVITATPVAGGRQESDGSLSIDNFGQKIPADKW